MATITVYIKHEHDVWLRANKDVNRSQLLAQAIENAIQAKKEETK